MDSTLRMVFTGEGITAMKRLCSFTVMVLVVFLWTGLVQAQVEVHYDKGTVDWSERIVSAVGMGVPREGASRAQGKVLARRAAIVSAQRELLGIIKGMSIDSETLISEGITMKSQILTTIQGHLKGAVIIDERFTEGIYEVEMALSLGGVHKAVLPMVHTEEEIEEVEEEAEVYIEAEKKMKEEDPDYTLDDLYETITEEEIEADLDYSSIIVDCRGLGVKSTIYPRLLSESGEVVYGTGMFDEAFSMRVGPVGYVTDLNQATHLKRAGRKPKPFFLKAVGVEGKYGCDPVISDKDAEKIKGIDGLNHILDKARVIFVVDPLE